MLFSLSRQAKYFVHNHIKTQFLRDTYVGINPFFLLCCLIIYTYVDSMCTIHAASFSNNICSFYFYHHFL